MIVVALLVVILMGAAGLSIDTGRLYITAQELQNYVDAAALSGTRALPYGSESASVMKEKCDDAVRAALRTYASNLGISADGIPSGSLSYTPAWNTDGTNFAYTHTFQHTREGKQYLDHVTVTVFYQDPEALDNRDLPKERLMHVAADREIDLIFAQFVGPDRATASRPCAGFRGVFEVKWKYYTRADVHGTPIYSVDPVSGREMVYTVSKDGFIYALDAIGEENTGRTWAYWKYNVLGSSPWGERHLCFPYTGKYDCEPVGQSEHNANYAILSSPKVARSKSINPPCSHLIDACYEFEALNAVDNGDGTTTLSYRVCSDCTNALSNIAFSLPSGIVPSWPTHQTGYSALKSYNVESPTNNPFYSIKFETIGEGIKNGQCETFRFVVPTSVAQYAVQVQAKSSTIIGGGTFGAQCSFWDVIDNGYDLVIFSSYPLKDDNNRGRLYALNASDGQLMWDTAPYVGQRKYHLGAYGYNNGGALYIDSAPAFSPDGTVIYYASRDGRIYAFEIATGDPVWADCDGTGPADSCFNMTGGTFSTPYVHPIDGTIYVATSRTKDGSGTGTPSDRGVIHAINPDGTLKWTWTPPRSGNGFDGSFAAWPPNNPTALYIGSRDTYLYKIDISGSTPDLMWQYQPPNSLTAPDGQTGNPRTAISATPAIDEEDGSLYIYFPTEFGAGFKLRDDGSSVTPVWSAWLGYDIDTTASPPGPGGGKNIRRAAYMSPALSEDFVYFGIVTEWDLECAFQAVRRNDGQIMQSYVMENDTHSSMRVAPNNWLYYASCDNYTYGVNTNIDALEGRLVY